jgi:putative flippase GtrA
LGKNSAPHLNHAKDSITGHWRILRFTFSSIVCAGLDVLLFALLRTYAFNDASDGIIWSTVAARLVSGVCNFYINHRLVFGSKSNVLWAGAKYGALFTFNMLMSALLTRLFASIGVKEILAKAIVDAGLFAIGFFIQKTLVFKQK